MKLKIYQNELDVSEFIEKDYECLLKEWMQIREQFPLARLYKDSVCVQNDVTPKTRQDALDLLNADADYFVVCHAGAALPAWAIWAALAVSVAVSVYAYMNMPKVNTGAESSGSSNNSLSQRQNKHRANQRINDQYGTVKSIPDLIAPVYRYYKDNVQVEECLLCIGRGYYEINPDSIKEAETPVNTIEGASISIYEPSYSLVGASPQIKIGEAFEEYPLVAKQISSIDGKQTLLSPNSGELKYKFVSFSDNKVAVTNGVQYVNTEWTWSYITSTFMFKPDNVYADFTSKFASGEQIIIENAIFGSVNDSTISGTTDVDTAGILTIATSIDINNPNYFKKIRVVSLLVNDATAGDLDLAGEYKVDSIVKSGSSGAWVYTVTLNSNFGEVNPNFTLLSADTSGVLSGVLTDNDNNIDLSGTYTIASVSSNEITLVNPATVNSDWNRLGELTSQQVNDMLNRAVTFKGSSENFIGWYYGGNKDTTGFILNFLAQNGIYDGDRAKQVAIEVHYQQVIDGVPTGAIHKVGSTMQGTASNRNPIGMTIKQAFSFTGQFRFRVKRINDNGNSASLVDDVVFESAYGYYQTLKSWYDDVTVARLKRLAIGSGTNASELNMIATRKLYSYSTGVQSASRIATNNFADIVVDIATDPYVGRMQLSEIDVQSLYELSDEIEDYFGTSKACEFNYTFDDKNSSYQEMIFMIAEAVFCTARRENGLHYFSFERETPNSLILFNHRNMKPESLNINDLFGIQDDYDGVELKWHDPSDNYAEAVIKLPDDLQTNYKTIETVGVTNPLQAHFLAWRVWNKLRFNRKAVEFTAYGEADLVTRKDRIALVDSTVPILCSGEIEQQDNTVLTLDYPVNLDPLKQYVIHLQLKTGVVDVIDIVQQIDDFRVEIARIPLMPLVVDGVAHATFSITLATESDFDAYLIEEKDPSATFESTVRAIQYDPRYYSNDKDHINELI
ncbi:MAG: hypothetical protein LWW88_12940 [Acinetobacter sp.]|uniref:host specificity factor TipJ family phage tail protein n=1 Tax=Acinetobacter sp. TaxID=472 RepID=UPI002590B65B|nr:host specificity factor TipJ family phage tail protein [Acinetobacter sp.]MCE1272433.1 hypothetical protein [Acinetobacter sp.]